MAASTPASIIIGHAAQREYLERSLRDGSSVHAYIFFGPGQVGKFTVAKQFAQSILCSATKHRPCGECSSCIQFQKHTHLDYGELTRDPEKKNIGVEEVREKIIHPLQLSSFLGQNKVAIVDQAQDLSVEAANCLLKTLEEPPAGTVLILVTDTPESLPLTLASRCQKFEFTVVPEASLIEFVTRLDPTIERVQARKIARLSRGRPGLAWQYVTLPDRREEILAAQQQGADILLQPIWRRLEYISRELTGDTFQQTSAKGKELMETWVTVLRDAILQRHGLKQYVINGFMEDTLDRLAQTLPTDQSTQLLRSLLQKRATLQQNAQPKLQLENFILEY